MDSILTSLVSPAFFAAVLTVFFTVIITRIIDHNYQKDYRNFKNTLDLIKSIDSKINSENLLEIARRQNNYYSVTNLLKIRKPKFSSLSSTSLYTKIIEFELLPLKVRYYIADRLSGFLSISIASLICLAIGIILNYYRIQPQTFSSNLMFLIFYLLWLGLSFTLIFIFNKINEIHKSHSEEAKNTLYKCVILDGPYKGKNIFAPINIRFDFNSNSTLDYKFLAIFNFRNGVLSIYKREKSEGSVSFNSGQDTKLISYYKYFSNFRRDIKDQKNGIVFTDEDLL